MMDADRAKAGAEGVPGDDHLRHVLDVYERGQTVEALRRAEAYAPLRQWRGTAPCILAARLAANAGAPYLAVLLSGRAWRHDRKNGAALAQYGYEVLGRRGPLALWQLLRERADGCEASPEARAELVALKGRAAAELRDFSAAEQLILQAESLDPGRPWIRLQRAHLLEAQDRVEAALDAARAAAALHPHPFYRPSVQMQAHLLQQLDRDADAINLLRDADAVLQSGPVAAQLYAVLAENGRWTEADACLRRYLAMSPLIEEAGARWVTSQRARVAYQLGRRAEAAHVAAELEDEFHRAFARRLQAAPVEPERVQLDVTFVRQHFKTCAPATMAALGRYWRMPADHLKLAEAMCYDGTPPWQQRDWAGNNGWYVREFRMTHAVALALITTGIPFAITTTDATSAHMMAVIGFDRARDMLLLRDPSRPYVVEVPFEAFLQRYVPFGPHAMLFMPAQEAGRVGDIELPDEAAYDECHRLHLALSKHDRETAAAALRRLEELDREAALTWEARFELAYYDSNSLEQARCLDRLLALFPHCAARLLRRLDCLREAAREERIAFLRAACQRKEADPALFIALARELMADARRLPEARRWLRGALRQRPLDVAALSVLAELHWQAGRLAEATELHWFAANLDGFREQLYQTWFLACRRTSRAAEALAHLEDRFARFGTRSALPALTLAWAWVEMEQPARARAVLEEALRVRPDDSYPLLRLASLAAGPNAATDAERQLAAARGKVRENDWLRAAAEAAEARLDFEGALRASRALLEREPLALDAQARAARAVARREGFTAALGELKRAQAAFPHHIGLQHMVVEWSREAGAEERHRAATELLEREPADAWAQREAALAACALQRAADALRHAEEAVRVEPGSSASQSVLGHVHQHFGRPSEAAEQYRRAVALSVDNSAAVTALLDLARTDEQRREELGFIERELTRQVVEGDGLLAFAEIARPILESDALLRILRQAHAQRPDLWHAWAGLVSQLGHMARLDDALEVARGACERFPHLPRTWLDLARVHRWRNDADDEVAAAEKAFEINPAWNDAAVSLAAALERRGRLDDARRVFERSLCHSPRDAHLQACLAHVLWQQRHAEAAMAAAEQAVRLEPGYGWAWDLLAQWSAQEGQPDRPASFARRLTQESPGEMRVWMILARVLVAPADLSEALAAVEQAVRLDERSTEAWDLKAELLAAAERFEEARQACLDGAAVCTVDVHVLRGRQAWIEARRGRIPEAIGLMREVLRENGSYLWGLHELALWLLEKGDLAEAAVILERVRVLRPHDSWVNRQLGFLKERQEDSAGARSAFAAALAAAPTDVAAAHRLLDLQLAAADLDGAQATLGLMQTHQPGAVTLAAEISVRLRGGDKAQAVRVMETLCASPDPDAWPVQAAVDAFRRAQLEGKALKILRGVTRSSACNAEAAAAAVRLLVERRARLRALRLFMRLAPGELRRRAAGPLVHGLADAKCRILLPWLLRRRREALAADDQAWGQVGYGLVRLDRMAAAADWMADWRGRANAQPWMLFNLCLALRSLGRTSEATEAARHGVQTWSHRAGAADLHLFLAVESALDGNIPVAQEHLDRVSVRKEAGYDQAMLALARALVEFQQTPASERKAKAREATRGLAKHFAEWSLLNGLRDVRRTFRRTGEVFRRQGAGFTTRLWFGWRLNWQWFLLPIVLPLALHPLAWGAVLVLWRRRRRAG